MNKIIYSVGGYDSYLNWLKDMGFKQTQDLDEADTVFFAGGSDISPSLYGEKYGRATSTNPSRDKFEVDIFRKSKDKYKIGVCRGLQLLTALAGYKLVQHSNHPSFHDLITYDGKIIRTSSCHHQQGLFQKNPRFDYSYNYKLIAWSENLSDCHLDGNNKDYNFGPDYKEPEIVTFDNKSFGIQGHPEWMFGEPGLSKDVSYFQELVDKFVNDKL